jgi:ribonucleoside-diphosphate reductase alpha chain
MSTPIIPGQLRIIKREGSIAPYDQTKIARAITKAFLAVEGGIAEESSRVYELVEKLTQSVTDTFKARMPSGGSIHIEDVQDQVELALMRNGHHKTARAYVLYREEHTKTRMEKSPPSDNLARINVELDDGSLVLLDHEWLGSVIENACSSLESVKPSLIYDEVVRNIYDGIKESDLFSSLVITSRSLVEQEPNYSYVTARLLSASLRVNALRFLGCDSLSRDTFISYIRKGVSLELLHSDLLSFDLDFLANSIDHSKDDQFTYLGLQTLYDRYLIHSDDVRFETPQFFFMRVAMGLALNEEDKNSKALEFYRLLSSFDYMASTPTLFNSGTSNPQLSSCYLTTVPDDLHGIYGSLQDNAMLSKWAGGLGNDWTPVRALGSYIKGTNGKSQGVVPFLKVANDTAVAVNQGGKRKGAMCAYLETWHMDIEEFLELRKNTGDDRRRTHDMNTANWIPDLFMKRVLEDKEWTLFTPSETPDLHDLFGQEFEEKYEEYEKLADDGGIRLFKRIKAVALWRKMLGMLFETGHPWITFKDACNIRNPQQHAGVIHSSNLCTEITLNTSADEIAVCNLGSINLSQHITDSGDINTEKLKATVYTAVRMLDNVIDINYYAVDAARTSNMRHRPVGLGIMGFQDALYKMNIPFSSTSAVSVADELMEIISYYAISASHELALERGSYSSFEGSLWSQGILPIDSIASLQKARGGDYLIMDSTQRIKWDSLRNKVAKSGIRNSNILAIAPTATIANIVGVSQSIEPTYQNLYVKSNLSGEFTVVNPYLVKALKSIGLWDSVMINDLKFYDGSVQKIDRVPDSLKLMFKTAFEINPRFTVEAASRRQKWLDQSQSLNLYIADASGKKLDFIYKMAWAYGLKTTYYLRALAASSTEKSTVDKGTHNSVSNEAVTPMAVPKACSLDDPDCEACQ